MPTDRDLFAEEQTMVSMSFGEHIEELRSRLILALTGLMAGVILTFIPPVNLGQRVMTKPEISVRVSLSRGDATATVWTCDFSHGYVSINADYRS